MKKYIVVCLMLGLMLAFGSNAMAYVANSGIVATPHDLSTTSGVGGYATGETRICIFCHTPHHASTSVTKAPLWNRAGAGTVSYATYTSETLHATPGAPGPISKLCLSCHDGTVALNAYGTYGEANSPITGANSVAITNGTYLIGQNAALWNHHPVGIAYSETLVGIDGGLNDADTTEFGATGVSIRSVLRADSAGVATKNIECVSCHSVHNKRNEGTYFLWADDTTGSALCLTCHNK